MTHRATSGFWKRHHELPPEVQALADKAFANLRSDPQYPGLQFKRVGALWSARVDIVHRALAVQDGPDYIWVWIGRHDEYDRILRQRP